jgi:TPR repeat protein
MEKPLVLALASLLLVCACSKKDDHELPPEQAYAAPSAPPPVQMVNTMGGCEDVPTCLRECDAGAGDRCRRLGVSYEFGQGVAKDPKASVGWYERSCELKNATGCEAAGRMYEYHLEPKDMAKAAGFYQRACEMGWQGGCANWAIMLENGRGVPQDLGKARALYDGACKAGAGLACDRLKALGRDGG